MIYNFQQYSEIIKILNYSCDYTIINQNQNQNDTYSVKTNKRLHIFTKIINSLNTYFSPSVTITAPYFGSYSFKNYMKLFLKNIGYYQFENFDIELNVNCKINEKMREGIVVTYDNEFEKIISKMLPQNLPLLFVEGFSEINKKAEYFESSMTKIYYTANALHSNYLYKFFLAKHYKDIILVSHQHGGGGFGTQEHHFAELYERSVSNKYYTWGWKKKDASYLPHAKITYKVIGDSTQKSTILVPLTAYPRYLHRFQNSHIGALYKKYILDLYSFCSSISKSIEKKILFRDYQNYYGWNTSEKIKNKFENIRFDNKTENFEVMLSKCKVMISFHISTTYLESMSRGIPTLIYIDRDIYKFNNFTLNLIESLYQNNIVFYDIKLLVKHLESIYNNIDNWWLSEKVQEAKNNFLYTHARYSKGFVKEWKIEFDKLLKEDNDN